MHIVDGVLSAPVLVTGGVCTLIGVARGLRSLDIDNIPRAGLLTAVFFTASLIHIPLGPTSAHMMLTGLVGLMLGWAVFPAVLTGLFLQAVFFGFGGITVLGSNTMNIALPALIVGLFARFLLTRWQDLGTPVSSARLLVTGFLVGSVSFGLSSLLVATSLALSGSEFMAAARLTLIAQSPIMLIEGVVTAAALRLVWTVRPEVLRTQPSRLPELVLPHPQGA